MIAIAKGFIGIGAVVTVVIGLVMLGITIWAFVRSQVIFNNYAFLGVLLGADLLMIIVGSMGIFGVKKKKSVMVAIFLIFAVVLVFAFLGLGITAEVLPGHLFDGNCENSSYQPFKIAKQAYQTKSPRLCFSTCPCNFKDSTFKKGYAQWQITFIRNNCSLNGSAIKYQDCRFSDNTTYGDIYEILGEIEEYLDCSGWCTPSFLFYYFSDVNNGKPSPNKSTSCYYQLKDSINRYSNIVGIASFIASVFMLMVAACGCFVCWEKRGKGFRRSFFGEEGNYSTLE